MLSSVHFPHYSDLDLKFLFASKPPNDQICVEIYETNTLCTWLTATNVNSSHVIYHINVLFIQELPTKHLITYSGTVPIPES